MMGSGFSKMKKQARMMQAQIDQVKKNLQQTLIDGTAGGGLVTITLNGERELKKIVIKPECTSDVEGLQDLILAAFEDANKKLEKQNAEAGDLSSFYQ